MIKNKNSFVLGVIAVIVILLIILIYGQPIPSENYCDSDTDCACGVHVNTRDCFVGNKRYVDTEKQCPDFCSGIGGNRVIKCISNECNSISG